MNAEVQKSKKTCVITGANSGIGKAAAIELALQGFEVILLVRDSEKSRNAYEEIKRLSGSETISMIYTDLASLTSIRNAANKIKMQYATIDILINNAGIFTKKQTSSADGFELTFAVNYLATFQITNLLLPNINKNGGRIINLSSELYKRGSIDAYKLTVVKKYNAEQAYANSKLLINYFTKELAERLSNDKISVNCVHPGVVGTDVFREYPKWFNMLLKLFIASPKEGAKPVIHLATIPEIEKISGKYFKKMKEMPMEQVAENDTVSKAIWDKSIELTELNPNK